MNTQLEKAARLALEALRQIAAYRPLTFAECSDAEAVMGIAENAIPALRTALEQPAREPLTPREVELIDGMIEVQLHHAQQCDHIANRAMADKQKGWDMERVALLCKLKAAHGIKGEA